MHHNRPGFTLIEVAICLAIAGIVLGLAVPALQDAIARSRAAAVRSALLGTWTAAVGHAATTGKEVVLCPSTGSGCRDSFDWSDGWIAFVDIDGNRRRSAAEALVDSREALHDSVRLRSTTGRRRLVVQPNGGNAGSNVTFTLCDRRGIDAAVTLVLANNGRLRAGDPSRKSAQGCVEALRRADPA